MAQVVNPPVEMVAIGCSLGGLLQLERLLSRLPGDFPAAVAICQHQHEGNDSALVRLLSRHCTLPISEPEHLELIVSGHVYVAPAGYHTLVEDQSFALSVDPPVCFARPSADVLFELVADAFGPKGAAVVLTSSSADGAEGARAVKDAGGRVAVQDPLSAESPICSRATLALTKPNFVGETEKIAETLIRWCSTTLR